MNYVPTILRWLFIAKQIKGNQPRLYLLNPLTWVFLILMGIILFVLAGIKELADNFSGLRFTWPFRFHISFFQAVIGFYVFKQNREPLNVNAYWAMFDRAKALKGKREYERGFILKYLRTVGIDCDHMNRLYFMEGVDKCLNCGLIIKDPK